jgi:hypothetical protein
LEVSAENHPSAQRSAAEPSAAREGGSKAQQALYNAAPRRARDACLARTYDARTSAGARLLHACTPGSGLSQRPLSQATPPRPDNRLNPRATLSPPARPPTPSPLGGLAWPSRITRSIPRALIRRGSYDRSHGGLRLHPRDRGAVVLRRVALVAVVLGRSVRGAA